MLILCNGLNILNSAGPLWQILAGSPRCVCGTFDVESMLCLPSTRTHCFCLLCVRCMSGHGRPNCSVNFMRLQDTLLMAHAFGNTWCNMLASESSISIRFSLRRCRRTKGKVRAIWSGVVLLRYASSLYLGRPFLTSSLVLLAERDSVT